MSFDTTWSSRKGALSGTASLAPMTTPYNDFLVRKQQLGGEHGFAPTWMPDSLFDFQASLVDWACRKGRGAIFANCGMGKTAVQLTWAENVVRHTNKKVLIATPLAVSAQTVGEGEKFGIACARSKEGRPAGAITVTNYESLHKFAAEDYVGMVCDESSIVKNFTGATQKSLTRFMAKMPYRLLCTATPSPNDYIELGTSSEALGYLGYTDMLSRFFVMDDKKRYRMNDVKMARQAGSGGHFAKLAYRVAQQIGAWHLKGHAQLPFWRWVCSWARACQMPSDLGFEDGDFILPPLNESVHLITPKKAADGFLFTLPAFGLKEERDERRRTLDERCETVASLVDHDQPAVIWCHFNQEGDRLSQMIPNSVEVKGSLSDDEKEAAYAAFTNGEARVMICKPKIGAHGLNWQHCAHVVTFASHSYEGFFQSIRRCWRFGQTRPVQVDIVATTGEEHVLGNMVRKAQAADVMFQHLIACMHEAEGVTLAKETGKVEVPAWLK